MVVTQVQAGVVTTRGTGTPDFSRAIGGSAKQIFQQQTTGEIALGSQTILSASTHQTVLGQYLLATPSDPTKKIRILLITYASDGAPNAALQFGAAGADRFRSKLTAGQPVAINLIGATPELAVGQALFTSFDANSDYNCSVLYAEV